MAASAFDAAHVKFVIVARAQDTWDVQFRIDVEELVDQRCLLRHLRAIKQKIAETYHVPEVGMVFDGIVNKARTEDFVDVVVRIKRVAPEKGNPSVVFKDGIAADGTRYSRMTALLDVYYLDRFERIITADRVMSALREASVADDLVENEVVAQTVRRTHDTLSPVKGVPVAKGVFPDPGKDAELEFYFQAAPDPTQQTQYYSSRRVNAGDPVCRKIPASTGKNPGRNVAGESLPPRTGLDIALIAESGVALSADGNDITAITEGVVVINRTLQKIETPHGIKEIPQSVSVKVNPVLKVQGDQVLDIATSQTVEVVGNLSMGSRILTDCEVYVSGNVEEGALIQSADSVTVDGSVSGSSINSQSSVTVGKDVIGSIVVSARGGIHIGGAAQQSTLVGSTVTAGSVSGSKVQAHTLVAVDRIDADEDGLLTTICVGMTDFFRRRLSDNNEFLQRANDNLRRMEILFGKDIFNELSANKVQTMFLRFLSRSHVSHSASARLQSEVYRKLMESVPPTRSLVAQKERENAELTYRIDHQAGAENNVIIVKEKIAAPVAVSMDGAEGDLVPASGPVVVHVGGNGNLDVTPGEALAA